MLLLRADYVLFWKILATCDMSGPTHYAIHSVNSLEPRSEVGHPRPERWIQNCTASNLPGAADRSGGVSDGVLALARAGHFFGA